MLGSEPKKAPQNRSWNVSEKYLLHQQNLFHVFIDFKKSLLADIPRSLMDHLPEVQYFSASLVRTIDQFKDKSTGAIQLNGSKG